MTRTPYFSLLSMVRLGTVAVADCIIFGRIAARTANGWAGC